MPELRRTANGGHSRGSKRVRRPHRREAEALEGSPKPRRGWSYRGDQRGSPASSSSGTAPRGLLGRATASYAIVECVCECWTVLEEAGVASFIGERRGGFELR